MGYRVEDFADELDELSRIVGEADRLNEWEEDFVISMSSKDCEAPLSHKQASTIEEIHDKASEKGWILHD